MQIQISFPFFIWRFIEVIENNKHSNWNQRRVSNAAYFTTKNKKRWVSNMLPDLLIFKIFQV